MASALALPERLSLDNPKVREAVQRRAQKLGLPYHTAAYLWALRISIKREEFCVKTWEGQYQSDD